MVLNSPLCKVTLQLEVIQTLFSLNGRLVSQNIKESIDVDDLFEGKALRLQNENHDCILLRRTRYFLQHKVKVCGCSIHSAPTKEIVFVKRRQEGSLTRKWLAVLKRVKGTVQPKNLEFSRVRTKLFLERHRRM